MTPIDRATVERVLRAHDAAEEDGAGRSPVRPMTLDAMLAVFREAVGKRVEVTTLVQWPGEPARPSTHVAQVVDLPEQAGFWLSSGAWALYRCGDARAVPAWQVLMIQPLRRKARWFGLRHVVNVRPIEASRLAEVRG